MPFAIRRAERAALVEHGGDHRLLRGGRQAQVDEAGAGDLGGFDEALRARPGGEGGDDLLGELARVRAERLRKLHRDVARDVAVRGDLRALQRDDGGDGRGVGAFQRVCDLLDAIREQGFEGLCAGSMLVEGFVGGGRKRRPPARF